MNHNLPAETGGSPSIHHPLFAALYERMSRGESERRMMEPLRKEIIAQASGLVLEVGAGTGLNFPMYQPERVERVDAIVPFTTRIAGNCHWNRDTASTVITAGFQMEHLRQTGGALIPIIVVTARRP